MELAELEIELQGEIVIAHLRGELDVAGAQRIGDQISEAVPGAARALVVDFSQLEFIDSSGIAMLFGVARRLASRRQEMRVVAPPGEPVLRVLEIVEFGRAAPIDASVDEALAALSPG